jgi:hypothetical protein
MFGASKPCAPAQNDESFAEVVNGFAIALSSRPHPSGESKLVMTFANAGKVPFDVVEFGPLFLEVEQSKGHWRSFQHKKWASDKVDDAHRLEPGHRESEVELVSGFVSLDPGRYRVRVCMVLDRGMLRSYESKAFWTGTVRSNVVEITLPPGEARIRE